MNRCQVDRLLVVVPGSFRRLWVPDQDVNHVSFHRQNLLFRQKLPFGYL
jgi:hypothetical protein